MLREKSSFSPGTLVVKDLSLDLGIKVEKRLQALPQLLFDFIFRPIEHVHGDPRVVSILQLDRSIADFCDLFGG